MTQKLIREAKKETTNYSCQYFETCGNAVERIGHWNFTARKYTCFPCKERIRRERTAKYHKKKAKLDKPTIPKRN